MLMGRNEKLIGHDPAITRGFALAHNAAYQHCDIDRLMATCSPRGGIWAGLLPPDQFVVNETHEAVRASYVELISTFKVMPPRVISMICTDWYACFEVTSSMIHLPSNQRIDNQAVCLFGNDELGTAVDMAWPLPPGARRLLRRAGGNIRSELIDLTAHETRLAGWRQGDIEQAAYGMAETGVFFLPCFDPHDPRRAEGLQGRAAYKNWLEQLFARYEVGSIAPLNFQIGDQHVFSETRWHVTDRETGHDLMFRYALVEILDAEQVSGLLGFATLLD